MKIIRPLRRSFLLLFYKKEGFYFIVKKKQKTIALLGVVLP